MPAEKVGVKKILFVCSGNTCRSPLAEVVAKHVLPSRLDIKVQIASAGTSAMDGSPASANSIDVARRHGLDLSKHRSRGLTREMVHAADLIVTMGVSHRAAIGTINADALEHTYLLTNFSDHHDGDILDPIGADQETYERTFGVIRDCVEAMAAKLPAFDGWKSKRKESGR